METLTSGIGWGAIVAALVGSVWEFRRNPPRAVLLGLFPLILFVYLGLDAERYFARWLLPAYPVLALFAGVAIAGVARSLSNRGLVRVALVAVLVALVMAQPIVASVRTGGVMEKADTRELARNYMLEELPSGTKVVVDNVAIRHPYDVPLLGIEPGTDDPEFVFGFDAPPKKDDGYPPDPVRAERFLRDLSPARIDEYRARGFCVTVTMSWFRDRAEIAGLDDAVAYYDRLKRESEVLFTPIPTTTRTTPSVRLRRDAPLLRRALRPHRPARRDPQARPTARTASGKQRERRLTFAAQDR